MGKLSTHVLDTAAGRPAAGMRVTLSRLEHGAWKKLKAVRTNAEGRAGAPLLQGRALKKGQYRLVFDVAAYFRTRKVRVSSPPFLDRVPIRFGVADPKANYHVPLLCSPWGYTTYRGS